MKRLRQQRHWSQEQLAGLSGLSLRTIQRIEGSNEATVESLEAIALAMNIDRMILEQELAMDKKSGTWKAKPAWVRGLFLGSGRIQMDREQHAKLEVFAVVAGVMSVTLGVLGYLMNRMDSNVVILLMVAGSALLLCAYFMAVSIRIGDRFSVWSWLSP